MIPLLKKKKRKKKLMPKSLKRMQNVNKVVKSVQKHQDIYLSGISAALHALKKRAK